MSVFTIAVVGTPLGSSQEALIEDFSKNFNVEKNHIRFVDISNMSEKEILAQGSFSAVLYDTNEISKQNNTAFNELIDIQKDPDDLTFFATSKEKVTDKTMETENATMLERYGITPKASIFPIKISNENEANAYLQGVVTTSASSYLLDTSEITDKTENKLKSFTNIVLNATKQKHLYTAGHVQRVSKMVAQLSKDMGFTEQEQNEVYLASLLHDIGKIGIPDDVLASRKALTYPERLQMNYHSQLGEAILQAAIANNPALAEVITPEVLKGIANHHKHYDGYHDRNHQDPIHGEAVGKYGLTIAVADCIDAMTSQRAYNNPKHILDTFRDLWSQKGKQFSPEVADAAILMLGRQIGELGINPNKMFAESYDNPKFDQVDSELKKFFLAHTNSIEVNQNPEPGAYSSLGFRLNESGYFEFEGPDSPVWDPDIRIDDEYIYQEGDYARKNDISVDRIPDSVCDRIFEGVLDKFDKQDKEGALAISRSRVQAKETRDLSGEIHEATTDGIGITSNDVVAAQEVVAGIVRGENVQEIENNKKEQDTTRT